MQDSPQIAYLSREIFDRRSAFCSSVSVELFGSNEMGLYLAKTSMPKSAVALAMMSFM